MRSGVRFGGFLRSGRHGKRRRGLVRDFSRPFTLTPGLEAVTAMSDFDLVVTEQVIRTDRILENGYVAVRDGIIERVGEGTAPDARERQDFGGALILPGAIDAQVHSRSQRGQEDFIWSTRAAAAGGVTTIVDMPYDDGFLVCTGERLRQKAEEAGQQARVDFALYGTVHPN